MMHLLHLFHMNKWPSQFSSHLMRNRSAERILHCSGSLLFLKCMSLVSKLFTEYMNAPKLVLWMYTHKRISIIIYKHVCKNTEPMYMYVLANYSGKFSLQCFTTLSLIIISTKLYTFSGWHDDAVII